MLLSAPAAHSAPRVTLVPAAGPAGSVVSLSGAGFRARTRLRVKTGRVVLARRRADRHGRFAATFAVRGGKRIVSSAGSRRVVNVFSVGGRTATSEVAGVGGTRVRWTPVRSGTAVALRIFRFPPHRRLRLTIDGRLLPGRPRTTGRGSAQPTVNLPRLAPGRHRVSVRAGGIALGFGITVGPSGAIVVGGGGGPAGAPPASALAQRLAGVIENVRAATAYRYTTRDDLGNSLDTLKVIPAGAGVYLGVYHHLAGGVFTTMLATSSDLLTWKHVVDLEPHASQPTIARLGDGSYVVAFEKDAGCTGTGPGGNCLGFEHYAGLAQLLAGSPDQTFQAPRTLSKCAEGTPNIYSANGVTLDIGFHYFRNCDVDRQARGTLTGFASWSARTEPVLNGPLEALGPGGNIGDRDNLSFGGSLFNLHEVQFTKGDFGSWRTYLFDWSVLRASALSIRTHRGSTAFANPTATLLTAPSGRQALLVTLFIPVQGAGTNEAGELVYYREL